ncbi:Krueppel homolog 1-like [Microplitis mediator]|uniref:Krueppel homolog 1-like n=1 Tax=Microplitis mediator TaxID=375433 RepID=UPI002552BBDA|nr:Krueppel homolog 1-like [Microplitis mediator]XP_057325660.1 Krueppel homolog 1-like [Microplitis mediator]
MVGYYPEAIGARAQSSQITMATLEVMKPVKSLVCSPDLTVFASQPVDRLTETAEDKSYHCLLCQKTFDQKSVYQSHLRSHGKEGEDPYRCNICNKTFAVPARLTRHYRTHTGEKPYQCEYCNKSFSVKENLSVHRRIHTKERPYKCDVCERAFEHSGKLHRHMRIHTGERPHKCSVCAKTFIQSGQLVIHMRTHTGEKPYVCKACGKGFTCSKQLKVHTRTHTGEKPYTCDICGKSFGYNHVLKLHQVAHYGEKVYKCTLCHETFNSKKTMEMHIKTHADSGTTSPRDSPIEPVIEISQNAAVNSISDASSIISSTSCNSSSSSSSASSISSVCSSISNGNCSDKENKTEDTQAYMHSRDLSYYLYPRDQYQAPSPSGVNPALLAAAAAAAAAEDRSLFQPPIIPANSSPESQSLFIYPESTAYTSYGLQINDISGNDCSSLLNLPGNDARRRVEAALEAVEEERQREYHGGITGVNRNQQILTPPSSNPVSPAPSPDPLDLAVPVVTRQTLILPPRKRCKAILESMESERTELLVSQRHSSVIQFARAS